MQERVQLSCGAITLIAVAADRRRRALDKMVSYYGSGTPPEWVNRRWGERSVTQLHSASMTTFGRRGQPENGQCPPVDWNRMPVGRSAPEPGAVIGTSADDASRDDSDCSAASSDEVPYE